MSATSGRAQAGVVRQLSICPECGFENHRSDRFCKTCGGLLAAPPPDRLNPEVVGTGTAISHEEERGPDAITEAPPAIAVELPRIPAGMAAVSGTAKPVGGLESVGGISVQTSLPPNGQGSAPPLAAASGPEQVAPPAGKTAMFGSSGYAESRGASLLRPRNLGLASVAALLIAGVVLLYSYHSTESSVKAPTLSSRSLAATPSSAADVPAKVSAPVGTTSGPSPATRKPVAAARASKSRSEQSSSPEIVKVSDAISSLDKSAKTAASDLGTGTPAPAPPAALAPAPAAAATQTPSPEPAAEAPAAASAASGQPEPVAPATVAANLAAAMPTPALPLPAKPAAAAPNVPAGSAPAAHANTQPLRAGGSVQAGKILSQTPPVYPAAARAAGVQGTVQLEATIGKDGTVRGVKLISGNRMLAGAAIYAVQHWRYQPTELNGSPIEVRTNISVDFRMP